MATIRDVAKEAGVSVATVSRVLNETGYVHEDTKKAVTSAIEKLNYSPNEVARSLYTRKSKLIGLLLPDITNPFFPLLARGVEDELRLHDFRLIFGNTDENAEKEQDYIQTFQQNNVIGIISMTNQLSKATYQDLSIPVVFLDRTSSSLPSVYADGKEGGRIAAMEMLKRGSRRITLIKGPSHIQTAQDRFKGSLEVLSASEVDFYVMSTSSFSFTEAEKWAKELFGKYEDTDGVIASNDIVATAVIHEALRMGKSIPNDIQIIGFDDIPHSSLLFPPLSTIRQPAYEMGREAAKLLMKLMKNNQMKENSIQLPVTFIERSTTRKVDDYV
ncbi:LacI family transcriptional regulator [Heyndrickxia shackletonii]|uniref:Catabolite control protein A n=1 Tax=Heyndrickxia shackletonii TaxID=157838 RepID=A0A0Q3X0T1_9BACI|nr:LacI family DNA-binding transcriptional regulator [Heyndrickxia shackletonii]KQL55474.1 LacI family transcriptional regulator [Heyndrickxia shackletonii]MBB2483070.1 LacI family DNA-binding transcriptional regulator [Bacillus sp. APMAM]NEY99371.1 LacI family transcriptional regulator [Heyndrickxia shackletonii]RTZ53515.1 LacI family transcriptional regulator [Bacillus sp. SAJ1]